MDTLSTRVSLVSGDKYTLNIGPHDYSSTAPNSLEHHNGNQFTTKDQDNDDYQDTHCADLKEGGWWYTHVDMFS